MRRREAKGAPSADLLVCFPSRAHLNLMPKPICSPARLSEPKRHQNNHHHHPHHHHHHLKKVSNRGGGGGGGGQASPLLWAKTKPMGSEISEPTSPKVTCAGQIKVRPKPTSCKNWQSVMEEIEKLHNNKKNKKRHNWVESLGIKKDIMQFLTCLRTIKFDFRCFGSFPTSDIITSDDDDEDNEDQEYFQENQENMEDGNETSRTVFSKWFMVLQEDQNINGLKTEVIKESLDAPSCAPPPNALLLMRCRSAPAKSWLEEREEEEEEEKREEGDDNDDDDHEERKEEAEEEKQENLGVELEEKRKKEERLVVMRYDNDFYKISSDIAKETWVVGGIRDPLSRSRSWKR